MDAQHAQIARDFVYRKCPGGRFAVENNFAAFTGDKLARDARRLFRLSFGVANHHLDFAAA